MSQLREYIEKHPSETQRVLGINYDQLMELIINAENLYDEIVDVVVGETGATADIKIWTNQRLSLKKISLKTKKLRASDFGSMWINTMADWCARHVSVKVHKS